MSEQKNVKEPQQPVEEEKNDTTVAVPATVNEVATKHPLQNRWVLWYDNPKKRHSTESWEENLKNVYTFNTVEDFWCLYNNILAPTKLSIGSNYHLFKEGIRPMWEDPINAKGGKWIFTNPRSRKARLDECWLYVMLSLIGETLQDEDDICGAVVSVRKAQDRIAIWSATANAEDRQKAIGRGFRQALVDLGKNETLKYQSHADAAASGSSFQNEVYFHIRVVEICNICNSYTVV
ncbi:eukaryotic initiation factor 4E, putative [Phytophthora infestans T30-4]|uniref:mRNA cap-binding protein n=1 Tax=Phytophthora infestans (strain T30-4) TaxID=403677 RepID=D0MZ29_PHYIT|nr:eukaryotic initiation factor 4E, putative [Phytophthora infestans T30-4]EEY66427.1 eukaryotic initiation factor 4E, putative [Phytophthora infestans T30-4]|eukprot:XP_002907026.1 eukaryotic initiation factor 4E, putative [Phytophthora infestans T30-4]